ncbi:hypothetical protein EVG20_g8129 [Dentipellis fragilis]|uniref:Aminodeoxychorismate lyase n=1 Tax=Dentipellis fragilis TaxID=205917 RepID=A0A4Y9Y7K2_9AGAM|nr:hypothetical protein EVG20_g8129 [Dentipellis fragilis]
MASASTSAPDFELITATRYDPALLLPAQWNTAANDGQPSPFMLLRYHHARLADSAHTHGEPWASTAAALADPSSDLGWPVFERRFQAAVRATLSHTGVLGITLAPAAPLSADPTLASTITRDTSILPPGLPALIPVRLDVLPTPATEFTRTKTTKREQYADARERAGLPPFGGDADVLLFSDGGRVSETSVRNVAFFRGGQWATPGRASGCLEGVMRKWLLEQGRIILDEQVIGGSQRARKAGITKDSVKAGEMVLLFNGVEGCRLGMVEIVR